jgi:uncharacterized protein YjbI with pentapeptide repeats
MGTILDRVDSELQQYKLLKKRKLSPELIGRFAALSQSFKPYRYLQNDSLIAKPVSPEKGQLLLSLVQSKMDHKSAIAIFNQSNFDYAELTGTYLVKAFLNNVQMREANLERTDLSNASLKSADMQRIDGRRAIFFHTTLDGADLSFADLRGCNFESAKLRTAIINYTNLSGANLRKVDLDGAELKETNLRAADLDRAKMKGANLTLTDLSGAILQKADLRTAILQLTNLGNADLRDANLVGATIIVSKGKNIPTLNLEGAKVSSLDWFDLLIQNCII